MKNENKIIALLANTFCPSEAGLREFKNCDGRKDCKKCWKEATKDQRKRTV